jgi:exodeoxyribonuclease X
MTLLTIDTETNGYEPQEVIELAWASADKVFECRYKPNKVTTWGALAVHNILPEELEGCLPSTEAKLPPDTKYIIGHNVDFDWAALGKPNVKRICTLAIARKLYTELDSHKLGALYYAFNGATAQVRQQLRDAHSAIADVRFCESVLEHMLRDKAPGVSPERPEELWQFSQYCRLPDKMTFGKHKGLAIKDLPHDYAAWLLRQPDMDEYVVKAVEAIFRKR